MENKTDFSHFEEDEVEIKIPNIEPSNDEEDEYEGSESEYKILVKSYKCRKRLPQILE